MPPYAGERPRTGEPRTYTIYMDPNSSTQSNPEAPLLRHAANAGTGVIPVPARIPREQEQIKLQEDWDRDAAMYNQNKGRALGSTVFDLLYQVNRPSSSPQHACQPCAELPCTPQREGGRMAVLDPDKSFLNMSGTMFGLQ